MGKTASSISSDYGVGAPSAGVDTGPIIQVALLGARTSPPAAVQDLIVATDRCVCEHVDLGEDDRAAAFRHFDVAVLADRTSGRPGAKESVSADQDRQLKLLQQFQIGVLIITPRPWQFAGCGVGTVCLPQDAPMDKVHGVLMGLARTRAALQHIDKQLGTLHRLSETLRKQFEATDHELRLASRLQRDFLPRGLPKAGPIRFWTIYRPCTWVSGDIYDIFRLDEKHWGFCIADAVGHGVAAGLLTMYIKHAIRPKRILEGGYELVRPSDVLSMLNDQLVYQNLPDSQFITGWYGLINAETLELRHSVAGHPPPMLIDPDGSFRELHGEGCLLGLYENQQFGDETVTLRPGQRVLLYSDGLDETLIAHRPPLPGRPALADGMEELMRLDAETFIQRLRERLDNETGSLSRADDVTVVMLEVTADAAPS